MDAVVRRRPRTSVAALVGCVTAIASVGCSLPVPGTGADLVLGYVTVDDVAHRARRVTPGLDLSLRGPRPALSLGWSDTVWTAESRAFRAPVPSPDGYRAPLGWQWTTGSTRHALGWLYDEPADLADGVDAVVFVHHGFVGLDLAFAAHAQGLALGLGRDTWLAVPASSDRVFTLSIPDGDASRVRLGSFSLPGGDP